MPSAPKSTRLIRLSRITDTPLPGAFQENKKSQLEHEPKGSVPRYGIEKFMILSYNKNNLNEKLRFAEVLYDKNNNQNDYCRR